MTKCEPRSRIACRVAARTAGRPRRFASSSRMFSGVSPGCTMRAVMPSAQADADTSSAPDLVSWCDQSAAASLSSISRSAVAASGTRSSASAKTMRARPSLVESEYSRRKSSMPPSGPAPARIARIRVVARASMRRSASAPRGASRSKRRAMSSSGGAYGAMNGCTCGKVAAAACCRDSRPRRRESVSRLALSSGMLFVRSNTVDCGLGGRRESARGGQKG